jgi:hypothetical protein
MQAASDIFLGHTVDESTGRQFYIRTLKNRRLGGISEIGEEEAFSSYPTLRPDLGACACTIRRPGCNRRLYGEERSTR